MKSHVVYASSALLGNEMTFIKLKKKKKKKKIWHMVCINLTTCFIFQELFH